MDKCNLQEINTYPLFTITYHLSIRHFGFESLGLVDHLLKLGNGGHSTAKMLRIVHFHEFGLEIGSHTVAEFLHSVYSGGLKQFGELSGNTFDTEQVGMVGPLEYEFFGYTGFFSHSGTAFLGGAFFEEVIGGLDACNLELGGVSLANSFNLVNFVSHLFKVLRD